MNKVPVYLFFSLILIVSCGVSKQSGAEGNVEPKINLEKNDSLIEYNVQIKIQKFTPYCGGMAPTEEMLRRRFTPANGIYILFDLNSGERQNVKTDNNGIINLNLAIGKYAIKEMYKDVSFEDFFNTYSDSSNQHMINDSEDCYKKWWSSYLSSFEISKEQPTVNYEYTISSSCFVGINPCKQYMGPYPP